MNETPVHRSDIKMVFLSNTSSLYKFIDCSHTNCYQCYYSAFLFLPARASEQGNVIGLVSVYIYI